MPVASDVLKTISTTFHQLGMTDDTRFPGLSTKENPAHEFVVAKTLCRFAIKRLEIAEREAIKAGVLGDQDKLVKGQEVTIWRPKKVPPSIIITARTSQDRVPMLNKDLLSTELRKRFSQEITDDIIAKSSKVCEPSVTYSVVFFN